MLFINSRSECRATLPHWSILAVRTSTGSQVYSFEAQLGIELDGDIDLVSLRQPLFFPKHGLGIMPLEQLKTFFILITGKKNNGSKSERSFNKPRTANTLQRVLAGH